MNQNSQIASGTIETQEATVAHNVTGQVGAFDNGFTFTRYRAFWIDLTKPDMLPMPTYGFYDWERMREVFLVMVND